MISMTRVAAMPAVIAVTGVLVVAGVVSMVLVPDILGVLMASVTRLGLTG